MIYVMKNRNLFLLTSGLAFPLLGAYAQKTPKPNIIYITVSYTHLTLPTSDLV